MVNMLVVLLALPVVFGALNFPSFTISNRFAVPIDTCLDNVTKSCSGCNLVDAGSTICHCSDDGELTTSSVSCFYYADVGCTGELNTMDVWGGCDTRNSPRTIYTVEGCAAAQETAAVEDCPFWIRSGTQSAINRKIYPMNYCTDYNCDLTNNNADSRSCKYSCDSGTVERNEYSTYTCSQADLTSVTDIATNTVDSKSCIDSTSCGVTVTEYEVNSASWECGSKKSPFQTKGSTPSSNYIMLDNDETPLPIGQCAEVRRGYYSYSYKYYCNEIATDTWEVQHREYLNTDECASSDETCDTADGCVIVETYVSSNTTFKCDGKDGQGLIGYYTECDNYNWESYYEEELTLFGECIPLKTNPLTIAGDDSVLGDQPWYENLRVVISCNMKQGTGYYPSAYLYVTDDCSGDFLFIWDWDTYYEDYLSSYGKKKCAIPQVKKCGNGADKLKQSYFDSWTATTRQYPC